MFIRISLKLLFALASLCIVFKIDISSMSYTTLKGQGDNRDCVLTI